jgi:hypothetical protein
MEGRTEHPLKLVLNGRKLSRIIIDQHYKEKHSESINDDLIINLVKTLDGETFPVESRKGEFEFLKVEPVIWDEKPHRVVLVLSITDDFVGVINAFRVNL